MPEYNLTGIVVEPHKIGKVSPGYMDVAQDAMIELNDKAIAAENFTGHSEGPFDLVTYDELDSYVENDFVFLSGHPEDVSTAVDYLDDGNVIVDSNLLPREGVHKPSRYEILKSQAASLVPFYSHESPETEYTSMEEILKEFGLEEANAMPIQVLEGVQDLSRGSSN
mgnify:CR=1 FL=1